MTDHRKYGEDQTVNYQPNGIGETGMRTNYLRLPRDGSWAIFNLVAFLFICFWLGRTVAHTQWLVELQHTRPWLYWGQFIAGLGFKVMLLLFFAANALRKVPRGNRVQTFSVGMRLWLNLAFVCLVLLLTLFFLAKIQDIGKDYNDYATGLELRTNPLVNASTARLKGALVPWLLTTPLLTVTFFTLRACRQIVFTDLRTYWQHVRIRGYFDKAFYRPGDQVHLMVKDRLSLGNPRKYRLHLNYVSEKKEIIESGPFIARKISSTKYWDTTAGKLHEGITLSLPPNPSQASRFDLSKPTYWEVLIEEEGSYFFCRFLINVQPAGTGNVR